MKLIFAFMIIFSVFTALITDSWGADNFIASYQDSVTVTTTSTKVLDASIERKYLLLVNTGESAVLVKMGSAHAGTEGVSIGTNGVWEPIIPPNGSIWVKTTSATSPLYILEGK